CVATLMGGYW
nr:immunoglobulin heavy chain junction region [Mus musculus]NSM04047.1 immunoglobulin heavy chain junction region [Mus musculus]NSM04239.1 immunoglobulin heavy chain junction region [Mus musculus]NSM04385.1 immunoglobulin heavy chain junction region [Mus musculus]NSM05124.1 immunoglobulin heavy chain junction region [Mus musculus]